MNYPWIDKYCLDKKGAEKDWKEEWQATRYMLRGKLFAMMGQDKQGRQIITLKLPPDLGILLRGQYPDIRPGYYMNKEHWNSMDLQGTVPDETVKDMIDHSYELICNSLPKKVQRDIR